MKFELMEQEQHSVNLEVPTCFISIVLYISTDFSTMKIPASSYSFPQSISSDPPDIRNWYPSYEYESFVLDTSYGFGDCEDTNRESQDNLLLNSSFDCRDSTKISDSSCTPTYLISEPPDIRNWIPSYVYESPELSANDNLKGFLSDKREDGVVLDGRCTEQQEKSGALRDTKFSYEVDICEKPRTIESTKCNTFSVDGKHEDQYLKKILDSLHSPSQLSEPPDIRNWFPSYKSEFPVFSLNDDFREFSSKDSECDLEGFVIEESDNEEGEGLGVIRKVSCGGKLGEKILSKDFVEHNCSIGDEKQQSVNKDVDETKEKGNLSDQNIPPIEVLEHGVVEDTLQSHCISPANNVEESSLNSSCNQQDTLVKEPGSFSVNTNTSSDRNDRNSSQLPIHRRDFAERLDFDTQTKLTYALRNPLSTQGRVTETKKSAEAINDKENEGKPTPEDGFISTKSKRATTKKSENEKNSTRPWKRLSEWSIKKDTVSSDGEKEFAEKRKALSDRTNLHHSDGVAVTGKWQCPQKHKPNLGPPLKQLRLEEWFRRA